MKKTLVAYFSASGITAKLAQRLAKAAEADTFEIRPQTPYTQADLNWADRSSRSSVEMRDPACRPPLKDSVPNVQNYEVVFVGFPVWWYREPSIIDTFMEACKWNGQTVIPFATSTSSGLGESRQHLQEIAPKTTVKEGKRFDGAATDDEIAQWVKSVL